MSPRPGREPFALRDARSHALGERAGADGDAERVVLSQVDVGVACPDELSRLDGDPLEQLLGSSSSMRKSGLVERSELGVLALELLLGSRLRGDVDEEALRVRGSPGAIRGDRQLVVDPDCSPVLCDQAVSDRDGLAGRNACL